MSALKDAIDKLRSAKHTGRVGTLKGMRQDWDDPTLVRLEIDFPAPKGKGDMAVGPSTSETVSGKEAEKYKIGDQVRVRTYVDKVNP